MGLLDILTLIFVTLKLIGIIDWSWWLVLLPTLVEIAVVIVILTLGAWASASGFRRAF